MTEVLRFADVSLRRDDNEILSGVSWTVDSGQRWVILGANGAGKTSLLTIAAARNHPTSGEALVLGHPIGDADTHDLRVRVGLSSAALADRISPYELVHNVVMTAAHGVTGRQLEHYGEVDVERARVLLAAFGMESFAGRQFGTLSEGERKRVQIARSLMADPEILLLDEPAAGLDFAGREELLGALTELAGDRRSPVLVLVTHHVEEIPRGFTHALLMRDGRVVAAGTLTETLTSEALSETYGMPVVVEESDGRWTARKKY